MNKSKIYVASSWRNELQPMIVQILLAMGHEVYDFKHPTPENNGFSWFEIDPKWKDWTVEEYVDALNHPRAQEGFQYDFKAMNWADICILVLPSGRSAHAEAGWMKGQGKSVFVVQLEKDEAELMYLIFDGIITTVDDIRHTFKIT